MKLKIKKTNKIHPAHSLYFLAKIVSPEKIAYLSGIKDYQVLTQKIMVEKILYKYFRKLVIEKDELGKPIIINKDKYISISHSGNYVGVIVSNNEVGLDIEKRGEREDKDLITWTIKESYLKGLGIGLTKKMNDIKIDYNNNIVSLLDYPSYSFKTKIKKDIIYTVSTKNM